MPKPDFRPSVYSVYRRAEGLREPGEFGSQCLIVASLLQAATQAPSARERARLMRRARQIAVALISPDFLAAGCRLDTDRPRSASARVRALVEEMERRGAPGSAVVAHILDSLWLLLVNRQSVEGGRVLAHRGRLAAAVGDVALTEARFAGVKSLGHALGNGELIVRGTIGLAGVAQARGNLPLMERRNANAIRLSLRAGQPRLASFVLNGMGITCGLRGDLARSVEYLWKALHHAEHPEVRYIVQCNLAQTLLHAGHFGASRSACTVAMSGKCLDAMHILMTLGCYALASAGLGDVRGVQWATDSVLASSAADSHSRAAAESLIECATALANVGLVERAGPVYQRGLAIAEERGYHDLRFRPDPTQHRIPLAPTVEFAGAAARASNAVWELAPDGLSTDMSLVIV